jgi:hypothetical protein
MATANGQTCDDALHTPVFEHCELVELHAKHDGAHHQRQQHRNGDIINPHDEHDRERRHRQVLSHGQKGVTEIVQAEA